MAVGLSSKHLGLFYLPALTILEDTSYEHEAFPATTIQNKTDIYYSPLFLLLILHTTTRWWFSLRRVGLVHIISLAEHFSLADLRTIADGFVRLGLLVVMIKFSNLCDLFLRCLPNWSQMGGTFSVPWVLSWTVERRHPASGGTVSFSTQNSVCFYQTSTTHLSFPTCLCGDLHLHQNLVSLHPASSLLFLNNMCSSDNSMLVYLLTFDFAEQHACWQLFD